METRSEMGGSGIVEDMNVMVVNGWDVGEGSHVGEGTVYLEAHSEGDLWDVGAVFTKLVLGCQKKLQC